MAQDLQEKRVAMLVDNSSEEVVIDGNLKTSRKPDDIPAFNDAIKDMMA